MILGRVFKTVVFFGKNIPQYEYIKESFSTYPTVKVFSTTHTDEVDQILHQSNLTAILINDQTFAIKLEDLDILSLKEAGVRVYLIDDEGKLSKEEIRRLSLKRVTTLAFTSKFEIKSKLEIFMLGRIQIGKYKDKEEPVIEPQKEIVYPRPTYFSHFKRNKDSWDTIISTHEQEHEIEVLFDRSWTIYCIELLKRAHTITEVENDPGFSKLYHGIIFPNIEKGTISIIHVKKDQKDFQEVLQRARDFLFKM